jgi:hypothetical protein
MSAIIGSVTGTNSIAVTGTAAGDNSVGVSGQADTNGVVAEGGANGLFAKGKGWCGVIGISESTSGGYGVFGENTSGGTGVAGVSKKWVGVYGETAGLENGPAGVWGEHKGAGIGVKAVSNTGIGLFAFSNGTAARFEAGGPGVVSVSKTWVGVYGETAGLENGPAGVWGEHKGAGIGVKAVSNTGIGLFAFSNGTAAIFQGDVEVTGDIRLSNADCAEDFDIGLGVVVEPGSVMVLGENGALVPCQSAYDKRVAGVVSGAGDYRPGIVLDKQPSRLNRRPIALFGKVYCKVDARGGSIAAGDLLTTSSTPGHAMKAADPTRAPGAVIGKALRALDDGQGLIPLLIALQ